MFDKKQVALYNRLASGHSHIIHGERQKFNARFLEKHGLITITVKQTAIFGPIQKYWVQKYWAGTVIPKPKLNFDPNRDPFSSRCFTYCDNLTWACFTHPHPYYLPLKKHGIEFKVDGNAIIFATPEDEAMAFMHYGEEL